MKMMKKVSFVFLLVCLVFTCVSNVFCAIDVRAVKTGDIIYFDNTNTNWDKVRVYFYSSWGGSEVVSWANSLEMTDVGNGIYALEITSDLNIESHNVNMLVFNNGKEGNSNQSIDLAFIDTIYAYKFDSTESDGKNKGYWYVYDKSELKTLYDEALTYEEPYYTVESYSELKKQIEISKSTLENEVRLGEIEGGGFQSEYFTVIEDLKNAIENLVVNKELIKNKIDEVKQINPDGYTEESVNNLNNAVTSAEEKYASDNVTVDDIKEQIEALDNAVEKLKVDKSGLELLISLVNEVIETSSEYIAPESLTELKNAVSAGIDVVNNELATVDEVNIAIQNIDQKADTLKFNEELIIALIQKANEVDFDKYTDESIKVLKAAIAEAESLLDRDKLTIEEFEQVKEKVNNALKALIEKDVEKTEIIEESSNPNTGNNIILLIAIMFVSLGICSSTIILSKKMKKNSN